MESLAVSVTGDHFAAGVYSLAHHQYFGHGLPERIQRQPGQGRRTHRAPPHRGRAQADGTGTHYVGNETISLEADMTLYAQWGKSESSFDVSLPGSTSFSIYQSTDGDNVTFECRSNSWFDSYTWYIDGVKQTSTSEEMTVDTSAMKAGIYTIMLKVKNNGTYWSETTTLMVNK